MSPADVLAFIELWAPIWAPALAAGGMVHAAILRHTPRPVAPRPYVFTDAEVQAIADTLNQRLLDAMQNADSSAAVQRFLVQLEDTSGPVSVDLQLTGTMRFWTTGARARASVTRSNAL